MAIAAKTVTEILAADKFAHRFDLETMQQVDRDQSFFNRRERSSDPNIAFRKFL